MVSPSQFNWAVSLNILVMVLVGGINTTFGPVIGAVFVSMFPAVVNINPWLQEILYGALSILAITIFPEGVAGLVRRLEFPSKPSAEGANRIEPAAKQGLLSGFVDRGRLDRMGRPCGSGIR